MSLAQDALAWRRIKEIADQIKSPHEDKIYVAKDYTKGDLRRDLLATIPGWWMLLHDLGAAEEASI